MKRLLEVVAEAPVVVAGRHEAGNFTASLDYIPGTALRGAVATAWLGNPPFQQEIIRSLQPFGLSFQDYFQWAFLSGRVCFPHVYPKQKRRFSFPVPLSARSCKRFPGFVAESELYDLRHGVSDVLLHEPFDFRCPNRLGDRRSGYVECNAPMEPFEGFCEGAEVDIKDGWAVDRSRRILARTAIENPTEIAQQGQLYSLEALEEGGSTPAFSGFLTIEPPDQILDADKQKFVALFTQHLSDPLAWMAVGRARTRGLGTIRLEIAEGEASGFLPALEERFQNLQEMWQQIGASTSGEYVFTVTLHSDTIVLDRFWRYASVLDEAILAQENPQAPTFHLRKPWFNRTRLVSGWNTAHQMPKEDELAIVKGAAFLYTTTAPAEALLPWLHTLEENGIGERRGEGFGQVVACHPFHYQGVKQ